MIMFLLFFISSAYLCITICNRRHIPCKVNKFIGMMHKIYFENRCLIICSPDEPALHDPNAIRFEAGSGMDIHGLVEMLETSSSLVHIYIETEDWDDMYGKICAEFKEVNAAGGLVTNRRGDFLLIRRNGLWDLPKGHQDDDEDLKDTARREVNEETGIMGLFVGDFICTTDHCYKRDGIWHLKHTFWYKMYHDDPNDLTPQKEEDITKVAWVAKSSLAPFLLNTYPSIIEVFREAGNLARGEFFKLF